ncbi:prephenate dehydratase [Syntrophomonas palmitatica]|uniref:prephenate dehydratase n=1 Tax=Syntrophomonas palmitatica TaxID=402877 RepID=UPI0006D16D3A|nr:prephenate dehydratase [Syntrophomonas palmitatica]
MKYAVLGPRGTFSEEAAHIYWGEDIQIQVAATIPEVFAMIENRQADAALVPLENSLAGSVWDTLECLKTCRVEIKGEISIPIKQHLMACKNYALDELELLISQPVALLQCERFVKNRLAGVRTEICDSTTRAAQILKSENRRAASIGNYQAAKLYDLQVIYPDIAEAHNLTRFVHIGHVNTDMKGNKSSLIFSLQDKPGALYETLGIFAKRQLNLSKIESRPSRDRQAEFWFYVEVDLSEGEGMEELLVELKHCCRELKYLGTYFKQTEEIDIVKSLSAAGMAL